MSEIDQADKFARLSAFLNEWFHKPDLEALRVCLSAYVAHGYVSDPPVWLFVVGPSSSGKTAIALRAISFLPQTYDVDSITKNSFLSGFQDDMGILARLKDNTTQKDPNKNEKTGNGVLLFSDFTTFLQQDEKERNEVVGQLRRIYDGSYSREVGNRKQKLTWTGKVTCLAAVTSIIDDYWSIHRVMGERFLNIRWRAGGDLEQVLHSEMQTGNKRFIDDEFRRLVHEYMGCFLKADGKLGFDPMPKVILSSGDEKRCGLAYLSTMVTRLRRTVKRNYHSKSREIEGLGEVEMPARVREVLIGLIRAHATLNHRDEINPDDIAIAWRVGLDSVQLNRGLVMNVLFNAPHFQLLRTEIETLTGIPHRTCYRVIEDLLALDAVSIDDSLSADTVWVTVGKELQEFWNTGRELAGLSVGKNYTVGKS